MIFPESWCDKVQGRLSTKSDKELISYISDKTDIHIIRPGADPSPPPTDAGPIIIINRRIQYISYDRIIVLTESEEVSNVHMYIPMIPTCMIWYDLKCI